MTQQLLGFRDFHHNFRTVQKQIPRESPLKQFIAETNGFDHDQHQRIQNYGRSNPINSLKKRYRMERNSTSKLIDYRKANPSPSPSPSGASVSDERFKEIEQILTRENGNLKQHRDYLVGEVRRCNDAMKRYKRQLKQYERKIEELEHENDVYRMQYMQIKEYVFQGINQMESIVDRNQTERTAKSGQSSPQIRPYNQQINCYIEEMKQFANFKSDQQIRTQEKFEKLPDLPNLDINLKSINPEEHNDKIVRTQAQGDTASLDLLEDLNERFEVLMREYRATKSTDLRRKCIALAKEIKTVKEKIKEWTSRNQENPELAEPENKFSKRNSNPGFPEEKYIIKSNRRLTLNQEKQYPQPPRRRDSIRQALQRRFTQQNLNTDFRH